MKKVIFVGILFLVGCSREAIYQTHCWGPAGTDYRSITTSGLRAAAKFMDKVHENPFFPWWKCIITDSEGNIVDADPGRMPTQQNAEPTEEKKQ
jgi:3-methyladenine DNA glycosylase AlkD